MCGDGAFAFANDQYASRSDRMARSIYRAWRRPDPAKKTWHYCRRAGGKSTPALAKKIQRPANRGLTKKAKGAFVSESALHCFDGGKPNSVGLITQAATIIYLIQLRFSQN